MNGIRRYPHSLPLPLAKAVSAGGFLFLSGQLAFDEQGNIVGADVQTQTRFALEKIAQTLRELGASMAQVVRVTVWLADMNDFAAFNEEYKRHFTADLPVRCTVEARLFKNAKVEIEVQAWVGASAAPAN